MWLFFQQQTNLLDGRRKRVLHIAPERCLSKIFNSVSYIDYVSADIRAQKAMLQVDVTNMSFADNVFDVIICSHVLEHVENDHKALGEIFRTLRPGGWAAILVPIWSKPTFEDSTVKTPEDRKKYFGNPNHVRMYGMDFYERVRSAGFDVHVERYAEQFNSSEKIYYGLNTYDLIFLCTKPIMFQQ